MNERGKMMKGGTMEITDDPTLDLDIPVRPRGRFGVRTKIIVFLVAVLAPLVAITWMSMVEAIRDSMMDEFGGDPLLVFGGVATAAILAGALFARHITKPIAQLVAVAKRVGQGDLSQLVPVTSRDEIGELAATLNQTIVRLRSQVQTETERDEERRKRQELQQNIARFLNTVMEISQGDLTRRGSSPPTFSATW